MLIAWLAGCIVLGGGLLALIVRRKQISMPRQALSRSATMVDKITEKFPTTRKTPSNSGTPGHSPASSPDGLQGNLAQTPLHDLLQFLALGHKTGILELASGRRTGRVVIHQGLVRKNSYRGKDGLEALFLMLDLTQGDFEFYEQTLDEPVDSNALEVVDIIMLWMDRSPKRKNA